MCVYALTAALDLSQPNISRHLAVASRQLDRWPTLFINPSFQGCSACLSRH
ncbi:MULTISPECIES: ArsR family transcriptional regulator [unclassified Pseudomonas]|uniref:ArsR family transcriptional regulator n=1 Tax=unclassified Pseudomonas TaxID=196821 RepID=UPI0035322EC6